MRPPRRARTGLFMVELVLALLLWLALLFFLIQLALLLWAGGMVHHAAWRAARAAIVVAPADLPGEPRNKLLPRAHKQHHVAAAARAILAPFFDDAAGRLEVMMEGLEAGGTVGPTDLISVTVRFRFPVAVPLMGPVFGELDGRGGFSRLLSATVRLPNEGLRRKPTGP